jgi:hypothetical protein
MHYPGHLIILFLRKDMKVKAWLPLYPVQRGFEDFLVTMTNKLALKQSLSRI